MSNRKTAAYIIFVSLALVLAAIIGLAIRLNVHKPPVIDSVQASLDDTLALEHSEIKVDSDIITPTNKIDAAPFLIYGSGGWAAIDSNGKTRDSVYDNLWYVCDYKAVPAEGLFVDTTFMDDHSTHFLDIHIIVNRELLAGFGFTRPSEDSSWWWFTDINKKALTPPTPGRPWIITTDTPMVIGVNNGTITIK